MALSFGRPVAVCRALENRTFADRLFDHPVCAKQDGLGHPEPKHPRRPQVHAQPKLCRLHDRHFRGICTLENAVQIFGGTAAGDATNRAKGQQTSGVDKRERIPTAFETVSKNITVVATIKSEQLSTH